MNLTGHRDRLIAEAAKNAQTASGWRLVRILKQTRSNLGGLAFKKGDVTIGVRDKYTPRGFVTAYSTRTKISAVLREREVHWLDCSCQNPPDSPCTNKHAEGAIVLTSDCVVHGEHADPRAWKPDPMRPGTSRGSLEDRS